MIRLTYKNLATDTNTRLWVQNNIADLLIKVRNDRRPTEERWLKYWDIWNVQLSGQGYSGRAKTYLPAGRNALETWVMTLNSGLFPFGEWFGCDPVEGVGTKRAARSWQNMQRHFLNNTMQIKLNMPMLLRQYVTLGTAVMKQVWEEEVERLRFFERVLEDAPDEDSEDESLTVLRDEDEEDREFDEAPLEFQNEDNTRIRLVERDILTKVGPTMRVVDLFHFYVWPRTSPSIHDAQLIFEDTETTIEHIKAMNEYYMDPEHEEMGMVYDHIDELVEAGGGLSEDILYSRMERQRKFNAEFDPNDSVGKLSKGHVKLSECYWRGEIPGAKDSMSGEEYGEQDWLIVLVNDYWPIRIHPNPFYSKRRPYKDARFLRVVDEYYGRGVTEAMASMQYMLNDINNLTIDNITNSLNPIILINEDLVTNVESLRIAPNAKWFVDPSGVQFITPPNVAAVGLQTIGMMQGMIQDASGASFIAQGRAAPQGRGRAQNTASGLGLLNQQSSQGFQFALTELEEQLMIPILEWNYQLAEQFMTEKLPLLVGGEQNIPLIEEHVGFEDVFGKYRYTWKGAQGVKEQMSLTQQMQNFMQLAIQIRQADPNAQFEVKWSEVLRAFITKGMGLPTADEWIILPDKPPPKSINTVTNMLKSHRPVEAGENDNAEDMLRKLIAVGENDPQFRFDPIAKNLLETLMKEYVQMIQDQMAAQQEALMQAMMGGGGPGTPQGGGGPAALPSMDGGAPPGPPAPTDMNADLARSMQTGPMGGMQ
jgi:hypothetical protein